MNMTIKFELMRNPTDPTWFIGCTWEDLKQKHRRRSCWNRLTLTDAPAWMAEVVSQIDSGKLKGNDA